MLPTFFLVTLKALDKPVIYRPSSSMSRSHLVTVKCIIKELCGASFLLSAPISFSDTIAEREFMI